MEDPNILTDEIYFSKFEIPRRLPYRAHELVSASREVDYGERHDVDYLRIAFPCFILAQLLICFLESDFGVTTFVAPTQTLVSNITLCLLFLVLRNQGVETRTQRNIVFLFLSHCFILCALAIRSRVIEGKQRVTAGVKGYTKDFLQVTVAVVSLGMATLGLLSLRRRYSFGFNN